MLKDVLKLLGFLGYIADTPGALARGLLAGRPGERVSGRELLETWGLLEENRPGLDIGDILGLGADVLVDPLNLIGLAGTLRLLRKAGAVKKSNLLSRALREAGAMPEEIAEKTVLKVAEAVPRVAESEIAAWIRQNIPRLANLDDATLLRRAAKEVVRPGQLLRKHEMPLRDELLRMFEVREVPRRMYHGTPVAYEKPDPQYFDPGSLYGPGYYTTTSPRVASGYAGRHGSPNVRMQYLDIRQPFDMEKPYALSEFPVSLRKELEEALRREYSVLKPSQVRWARATLRDPSATPEDVLEAADILKDYRLQRAALRAIPHESRRGGEWYTLYRETFLPEETVVGTTDYPTAFEDILRSMGYDAIIHQGGQFVGNVPHRVAIVWNPEQVYKPYIAPRFQEPPSLAPLLTTLGLYNFAQTPAMVAAQ